MKKPLTIFLACFVLAAATAYAGGSGDSGKAGKSAGNTQAQTGGRGLTVEEPPAKAAEVQTEEWNKATEIPYSAADIAVSAQLGQGAISSVAFSPDGKLALAGSIDSTVKLYDIASGMEIRNFGHTSGVCAVAFSPDGKQVLSGYYRTVKLWDAVTGNEIRTFEGHTNWVYSVAFSPDGKQIVSGSTDKTVKLWDAVTGNEIRTFEGHTEEVYAVAFSPDGKQVVSGSGSGLSSSKDKTAKLWDAATGKEIRTFSGHTDRVTSVAFSPDGKQIVSGSSDKTIKLWDAATGKEIRTFSGHTDRVTSVAFSPDGKRIVSGSGDSYTKGSIALWDAATGKAVNSFNGGVYKSSGGFYPITSVAFSPDGKRILSGHSGSKKPIIVWDTKTGKVITSFSSNFTYSSCAALSPDGKQFISVYESDPFKLWDASTGRVIRTFEKTRGDYRRVDYLVTSIVFSPDGKQVLRHELLQREFWLWDVATGRRIRVFEGHTGHVLSVAFSPDGKQIISGSRDKTVKLWDAATGKEIRTFSGHTEEVNSVAFSPDGKRILSGSRDGTTKLWDAATGGVHTFNESTNLPATNVRFVAFHPDGVHILSYFIFGGGQFIRLWDTAARKDIIAFPSGHTSPIIGSVCFSPDGKRILTSSDDYTARLFDAATGSVIRTFRHLGSVKSAHFSPDGRRVLTSSLDGTIHLWDTETGNEIAQFISFSGSDTRLATASRGLTVETETASASNEGEWLTITPDGYYQATPRGDRCVNVRVGSMVSGIDSYRKILYNPDVVQARLQGRPDPVSKGNITIQQAANFMPPEVTIQSPVNSSTTNTAQANLSVSISDQNQPIKNIKIFVNGRHATTNELSAFQGTALQPERAGLSVTGDYKTINFTMQIELDPGPNRIEVVAFNGYSDTRRYVDVTWKAPAKTKPALPNLWILAVGINGYDNAGSSLGGLANLNFCVADAKELIDSLKKQKGKRYAQVNSLLIADGEAVTPTADNIRQNLKYLDQAGDRDIVLFFLAGHGISAQEGKFFFLPKDAAFSGDRVVDASKAISGDELVAVLEGQGNRLLFIDACQSGGVDNDRMVRAMQESNAFVFAASQGYELSYEDPRWGHGAFTYSILNALKGAPAALAEGNVSVRSMSGFVSIEVPKLTNNRQNPKVHSLLYSDFPMAKIK